MTVEATTTPRDRTDSQTPADSFPARHIGPSPEEVRAMLGALGYGSLAELIDAALPRPIRMSAPLADATGRSEAEVLAELRDLASRNRLFRSHLGMGYHDCVTPAVLQRNILENPDWYTPYTPYQAEIAQGRLEALLNFQTMIIDLTAMDVANASLLDESTAAAEAMSLCRQAWTGGAGAAFFVSEFCHPQTIAVVATRAKALGIKVVFGRCEIFDFREKIFGALLQYPRTGGRIPDYRAFCEKAHKAGALVAVAADLLALTLITPPGEFGADVCVGTSQRFGVSLGYGGPHAAFFATRNAFKRLMPGRVVGVSKDAAGRPALRLALQTREQHIRRERATSNICTAQALLAAVASMYAVYHGPEGLRRIARRIHRLAAAFAAGLNRLDYRTGGLPFFDTVHVEVGIRRQKDLLKAARDRRINLRPLDDTIVCVAMDETTTELDVAELLEVFAMGRRIDFPVAQLLEEAEDGFPAPHARTSPFLTQPVFNRYHSETEMMRYLKRLASKDLSLAESMIPLGSCTMKLNAAAEMLPITWPEFARLHPFVPKDQAEGYRRLFEDLESRLCQLTGFDAASLMPNSGAQGEYAGLLTIRAYHDARREGRRNVCLIPQSAHGTNPASAAMAGLNVVAVRCGADGNVDVADLKARAEEHRDDLAALMITYPSTHGVFEETIEEIARIVHENGGQVYMDGANFNAQVGLCRPGDFGADLCHLNLHKTFCIPHGGGGPGMGPIAVKAHLAAFLPRHPVVETGGKDGIGPVSAAPWGSAGILPIPWVYLKLMGGEGLTQATRTAILNANYVARRLEPHYPVLYKGRGGLVAHECILDLRPLKDASGVQAADVAKRLMDYGFHAPTISFPVPGTMMIEPTESESKGELDRFCEAMILIRGEIREIERGEADRKDNVLMNAPHPAAHVAATEWTHPYSREKAAFPAPWSRERKYWPPVGRIDDAYGDRNFVCSCAGFDADAAA